MGAVGNVGPCLGRMSSGCTSFYRHFNGGTISTGLTGRASCNRLTRVRTLYGCRKGSFGLGVVHVGGSVQRRGCRTTTARVSTVVTSAAIGRRRLVDELGFVTHLKCGTRRLPRF